MSAWYCIACGGAHPKSECYLTKKEISKAPLETPSHNGQYVGTAAVRTIPSALGGRREEYRPQYGIIAGVPARFTFDCRNCGREFKCSRKEGLYCSLVCRSSHNSKKRRKHGPGGKR